MEIDKEFIKECRKINHHRSDNAEFSGTYTAVQIIVISLIGTTVAILTLPVLMIGDLLGFIYRGCKLK